MPTGPYTASVLVGATAGLDSQPAPLPLPAHTNEPPGEAHTAGVGSHVDACKTPSPLTETALWYRKTYGESVGLLVGAAVVGLAVVGLEVVAGRLVGAADVGLAVVGLDVVAGRLVGFLDGEAEGLVECGERVGLLEGLAEGALNEGAAEGAAEGEAVGLLTAQKQTTCAGTSQASCPREIQPASRRDRRPARAETCASVSVNSLHERAGWPLL